MLGTDIGYDPSSHEALVKTLAALRAEEVVLVEQVRYRDVFGWFLDELERAGFALAGRVDDVGERALYEVLQATRLGLAQVGGM